MLLAHRSSLLLASLLVCASSSCSSSPPGGSGGDAGVEVGTKASLDFSADLGNPDHFYDAPYPSDLRLTPAGTPDLSGLPIPSAAEKLVVSLKKIAGERRGFPVISVGYFHFDGPIAASEIAEVIPASFDSKLVLVDVDPASPERGKLVPTVASALLADGYLPDDVLAVAARPGFVLHPSRQYAYVVFRAYGDAAGKPLGVSETMAALARGEAPSGPKGEALRALYAPLFETLRQAGVDPTRVAAATVFTTGDVVKDTFALSEKVVAKTSVTIDALTVNDADGVHPGYCELTGTVTLPQYQQGKPPFDSEGLFALDADGMPKTDRNEVANVVLTIPQGMLIPAKGLPLVLYLHGSGGLPSEATDASKIPAPMGEGPLGEGPASFVAPHGFAMIAASLPFGNDRFPSTNEQSYLNFNNLAAFRDTFRQGILEQRLFLAAAKGLRVSSTTLLGCPGVMLAPGAKDLGFDPDALFAMGQSMGGAYTNYLGALEPRIKAVVPTGAGGFWSFFVLETKVLPNAAGLIGVVLGTPNPLSFAHPALHMLETAWEPVDPLAYVPRLAQRPLDGQPVRQIYEPVGKDDRYFSTAVYDAMALGYGNRQAGKAVWPAMQEGLALDGRDGILPYPVVNDVTNEAGKAYTGVVVQYAGDGIADPHAIYRQLEAVKHQYGCFLESFLKTGVATVPAPAALGTPCP
ncbi:MAG: hypothetical protein ABI193_11565 [Minicystis sp.]